MWAHTAGQAKYNVEVVPDDVSNYEFSIRTTGENAQEIYTKSSTGDHEVVIRLVIADPAEQVRSRAELLLLLHQEPA